MYDKGKKPGHSHEHKGYHGSHKETHKVHGGEMAGTKELSIGSGPGKTGMMIKPVRAKQSIEADSGKNSYKPKNMSVYSEE